MPHEPQPDPNPAALAAATPTEIAEALSYALRYDEWGKPRRGGWDFAARLAAERLTGHLRRPAAARVDALPPLHGPEPFPSADRPGAGPGCFGRAGHDGATALRLGRQTAAVELTGKVSVDEYLRRGWAQGPAGDSGQKGRLGRRRRLPGAPGCGTLDNDKPPILGLIQRGGQVVLRIWPTCGRPRSSRSSRAQPRRTPLSTRASIASTLACQLGATSTKRFAMAAVNTPVTRTATGPARFTSTRWRAFGRCYAPGCARTGASRTKSHRFTSALSSSCTTRADAAKPCSPRLSLAWLRDEFTTIPERNKC